MKIEIADTRAASVANRWRKNYQDSDGTWKRTAFGDSEAVYKAILACPDDPEKIAAAIGNKSWTSVTCGGCGDQVSMAVEFSEYSETFLLCRICLKAGSAAIEAVSK